MARRPDPVMVVTMLVLVVVVLTGVGSGLHGFYVLVSSLAFDQGSPTPPAQRWFAVAGVVAAVVVLAALVRAGDLRRLDEVYLRIVVGVVVVGVACSVPLWRRDSTIDVTGAGFGRAHYAGLSFDLHVYNATDEPLVICVGADGVCSTEPRFPARLRSPGLTIPPGSRTSLKWPGLHGRFTLTVTSPLPPGARRTTAFTKPEPVEPSDPAPDFPDPYWPPPPPPPPPMPPLR